MTIKDSFWRQLPGWGLAIGLALGQVGVLRLLGPVPDQLRTLGALGDPTLEPVAGVLAILAMGVELVAGYLLVVLSLRALACLPGAVGRLASGGARSLTVPAVRRALDGLLGGVLLAQATLAPAAAHAQGGPRGAAPSGATPVTRAAAGMGGAGAAPTSTAPAPPWILPGTGPSWTTGPATTTWSSSPAPTTPARGRRAPTTVAPAATAPGLAGAGDLPTGPEGSTGVTPPAAGARPSGRRSTIRPGDTLWGIAADQLPAASRSAARIDRYWRQVYAANRAAVGADPDLIHPGTRLVIPAYRPAPAERP
jgi:nucleoid-associated protein YgaU